MKALGKIRRSEARRDAAAKRGRWTAPLPPLRPLPPKQSKARPQFTYGATMANLRRGTPKAILLKRDRLEHGWTRRQFDYIRRCDSLDWPVSVARLAELGAGA